MSIPTLDEITKDLIVKTNKYYDSWNCMVQYNNRYIRGFTFYRDNLNKFYFCDEVIPNCRLQKEMIREITAVASFEIRRDLLAETAQVEFIIDRDHTKYKTDYIVIVNGCVLLECNNRSLAINLLEHSIKKIKDCKNKKWTKTIIS